MIIDRYCFSSFYHFIDAMSPQTYIQDTFKNINFIGTSHFLGKTRFPETGYAALVHVGDDFEEKISCHDTS